MERSGHVNATQGGGSGAGFKAPRALQIDEPRIYSSLIRKIARRSEAAEKEYNGTSREGRLKTWNSALMKRLYFIDSIRKCSSPDHPDKGYESIQHEKSVNGTSRMSPSSSELSKTDQDSMQHGSCTRITKNVAESEILSASEDYPKVETTMGLHTRLQTENLVIHQLIPRLPKTIEEVVQLWRFGGGHTLEFPVKCLRDAKFRREQINGYSDKEWRRGQKQLFERYRSLVQLVSRCVNPPISDIYRGENEDEMWEEAVEVFELKWADFALTTVLASLRKHNITVREKRQSNERFKHLSTEEKMIFETMTTCANDRMYPIRIHSAKINLQKEDIGTLLDNEWVNDEIVNSFIALLNSRNQRFFERLAQNNAATSCLETSSFQTRPKTYMFNSFFFPCLTQGNSRYSYARVRDWATSAGIEVKSQDMFLFPVNLDNKHWVLAAIDMRMRNLSYIDSKKGSDNTKVLDILRRWLIDEMKLDNSDDEVQKLDIASWDSIINPTYAPIQMDNASCGIFMMYTADYLELGKRVDFSQDEIPILRKRVALFLNRGSLADSDTN